VAADVLFTTEFLNMLHVTVTINHHPLLPKLKLQIPIPVEGGKAGIGAALEDLKKFAQRGHFLLKMPMLVVGGAGNPTRRSQYVNGSSQVRDYSNSVPSTSD